MAGALGAAAAGAGGAYLALLGRRPFWGSGALKCAPAVLLAGACVRAPGAGGAGGGHTRGLVAAGLLLSAGGDVALEIDSGARAGGGSAMFLAGLGFFLAAHICYVAAFARGAPASTSALSPQKWAACAATAVFACGFVGVLWGDLGAAMRAPVAAYATALAAMAVTAVVHEAGPGHLTRILGAYLFVASDSLLGLRQFKFRGAPPGGMAYELAVMSTYFGAQTLIARALLVDAASAEGGKKQEGGKKRR